MSTSLESVVVPVITTAGTSSCNNNKPRHILKSRENIIKSKCRKELRKKLKKYKLRHDGQEDQEVLAVSQTLITSLKIKSPNNKDTNGLISGIVEEIRPRNYLFKMGRRKHVIRKEHDSDCDTIVMKPKKDNGNAGKPLDPNKPEKETSPSSINSNRTKINTDKDNTHTNAFKLMMDSRNKSIGSNSPGKEKVFEECDVAETIDKKNIKAKRTLLLQKMAETKGSLKNKEKEENQEEYIKKKMDLRAKRLKKMITETEKPIKKTNCDYSVEKKELKVVTVSNPKKEKLKENKLKFVNLFHDDVNEMPAIISPEKRVIKEDEEFLQKLSPSLRKKENMLCYFKKVEKEDNESKSNIENIDNEEENAIIKVKLIPKTKKKIKKKKLSLDRNLILNDTLSQDTREKEKTRKNENTKENLPKNGIVNQNSVESSDHLRPRRNVKRPAKYIEEVQLSSSDEELHIFTPKKKKHASRKNYPQTENEIPDEKTKLAVKAIPTVVSKEEKVLVTKDKKTSKEKEIQQKKNVKMAPIFAIKPQLDAAAIEAKQKFLSSGVPDKLKKTIEKKCNQTVGTNFFTSVVHVQQKENSTKTAGVELSLSLVNPEEAVYDIIFANDSFRTLLQTEQEPVNKFANLLSRKEKTHSVLLNLKDKYPKFPVYRTYRLLKDKSRGEFNNCSFLDLDNSIEVINGMIDLNNDSPDRLNWMDKFKPMSSKQIIGNFETTKELKKWLVSWTENDVKVKRTNAESDSSDFYQSDTDSKDSMRTANNLLILTGPVGSGKTSIVYAVAAELAIKVLEVNASSRRTGKIMLQDLQEATQSHKVNRGKSSQEIQKSQEFVDIEKPLRKRGRPKRNTEKVKKPEPNEVLSQQQSSQDSSRHCMSLILIDDADIVFEQDDGFCSAIVQLVQCSKRPVILITSSTTCPHLQKFFQYAKVIQTRPLLPRMLGTWLDIMCLSECGTCWPGLGTQLLDYFKGDIRKTINFLQFNTIKDKIEEDRSSQKPDYYRANIDDENSNMSWSEPDCVDEKKETMDLNIKDDVWLYFMKRNTNFHSFVHPMQLFYIWWNVPRLLSFSLNFASLTESNVNRISKNRLKEALVIQELSRVVDMVSIADYCRHMKDGSESILTNVPWFNLESDSVSEQENVETFDRGHEIMEEICHTLVTGTIADAQKVLEIDSLRDIHFPGMSTIRERDKITSRHNNLTHFLNPSSALDRRALALDYWPGCRNICRIERTKTDNNSKRNNRFCHYLKSLNVLCRNDSFENLSNSLSFNHEEK